jgi:hypothetical protein
MTFSAAGWVSVAELIVYLPAICLAIYICSRHGFSRSSGWLYTLILCLVRIIGAICQLLTYHDTSTGLLKATLIIDSIGLSPLLLATLGLLSRLADWVNTRGTPLLGVKHFRILQLLISLGLILSIAGGSSGSSTNASPSTTSKAAIVLFIVGFVGICIVWAITLPGVVVVPGPEKRISMFVIIALPFILVRLAYSALAVFVHNHTFNIIDGSVAVHAFMAVLEEFIVVGLYLILGWMLSGLNADEQGPIASRPWKERKPKDRSTLRRGGRNGDNRPAPQAQTTLNPPPPVHYYPDDPEQGYHNVTGVFRRD